MYKKILTLSLLFLINRPWINHPWPILDLFKSKETKYKDNTKRPKYKYFKDKLDKGISLDEYDENDENDQFYKHTRWYNKLTISKIMGDITKENYTELYNREEELQESKKRKIAEKEREEEEKQLQQKNTLEKEKSFFAKIKSYFY
jgi:hypothetical protein